jgi:hypothetical protein
MMYVLVRSELVRSGLGAAQCVGLKALPKISENHKLHLNYNIVCASKVDHMTSINTRVY